MLEIISSWILVFLIGLLASFIGTLSAGAGLISIPLLISLGMPPHIAIATNMLGLIGFDLGPLKNYCKHKKIRWKFAFPFTLMAVLGSALGAKILLEVNEDILSTIIGLMILFMIPFIYMNRNLGIVRNITTKIKVIIGYILRFFIGIWDGFFGAGSGFFSSFTNMSFFGFTIIESKATSKIPSIISSLVALSIFALAGIIDYVNGGILFMGMFVGGYIGGHIIIKKGDKWVKKLYLIVIILLAIKLIFF